MNQELTQELLKRLDALAGAALSTLCSGDTYANILVPEVAALENLLR